MKKIITLAAAAFMTLGLAAQNVQETVIAIGNLTVPAVTLSVDKDVKLVQNAMSQYLKDAKLKTEKSNGFNVAVNANIPTIAPAPVNLYTLVDQQGKGKKKATVVTVSTICTDLTIDQSTLHANTRVWLEGFYPYIGRYEAAQQMAVEKQNLKRAEKAAASAMAASAAIDKAIANDQKKIADYQEKIKKLNKEIKDCEEEIKKLEADIQRQTKQKGTAEEKVQSANQNVNDVQGEVERYRQLSE